MMLMKAMEARKKAEVSTGLCSGVVFRTEDLHQSSYSFFF